MHRFINFKGFADAEIDLFKPMTLLIGKNGSGKSNAIEGVELLAQLAQGRPLHEISDLGRGGGFEIRGGLAGCIRQGCDALTLVFEGCRVPCIANGLNEESHYSISIAAGPEPRIIGEKLTWGERVLFDAKPDQGTNTLLQVQYDNFDRGPNKPKTTQPSDRSMLYRYPLLARGDKMAPGVDVVSALGFHLQSSFVFDPVPRGMRQYDRIGNRQLMRNGANLSSVLYSLETGDHDQNVVLKRILDLLKHVPEEPFEAFHFSPTEQGDVLFGLRAQDGSIVPARLLSDGTLRCLAVLTALETVEDGSRLVVEEFDNGLHPSRTGILTQAIWDACRRRNLNVLCTTHNPATLDALTPEQLDGVVVAFWDKAQGASRLVPLRSLPRADVLLERGQLGDLVTRRVLEQHLAPDFEARAQEEAVAWLKSLP